MSCGKIYNWTDFKREWEAHKDPAIRVGLMNYMTCEYRPVGTNHLAKVQFCLPALNQTLAAIRGENQGGDMRRLLVKLFKKILHQTLLSFVDGNYHKWSQPLGCDPLYNNMFEILSQPEISSEEFDLGKDPIKQRITNFLHFNSDRITPENKRWFEAAIRTDNLELLTKEQSHVQEEDAYEMLLEYIKRNLDWSESILNMFTSVTSTQRDPRKITRLMILADNTGKHAELCQLIEGGATTAKTE